MSAISLTPAIKAARAAAGGATAVSVAVPARPCARGKFLYVGEDKFYVRGVTYGPFRPTASGCDYHTPAQVARDFQQMAAAGLNALRTYTVPPEWLLDEAERCGLKVMVGVAWEQHIGFLSERRRAKDIVERVAAGVRSCAGHPAVLCYAIGNEIPAGVVRWYGRRAVERHIHRLYNAAKAADPGSLVTYVNYPTTEYLQLPFLDLLCFNVYLERANDFGSYLARLQNLTGNRPLLMGEIGLDSSSHGPDVQAQMLEKQIGTAFSAGAAGAFVFSWTDEWYRGGEDITGWKFGLTDCERRPKPALAAVGRSFSNLPLKPEAKLPRISVVICTYNGSRTLAQTLRGAAQLEYPDYEVIVVDDGSTDHTAALVRQWEVRLISTPNRGLSAARNVGAQAATGEIVAYLDDDAWPDPHWLNYLAAAFADPKNAAVGGPNVAPPDDGMIACCVASAPGGPTHVLLTDQLAEHLPGCNLAIRKSALEAIGGFDPQFRIAGDDVDVCWRLQDEGGALGFAPGALVWHRRRNSVRAFWRQQVQYGKAEALLEQKWPEKYNTLGHLRWHGRLYHKGIYRILPFQKWRVYHGVWGTGLFQSIDTPAESGLNLWCQMPEAFMLLIGLLSLSALGLLWSRLFWVLPLAGVVATLLVIHAVTTAFHVSFADMPALLAHPARSRLLLSCLHLMQPVARLYGRLRYGLTPWRRRAGGRLAWPVQRAVTQWSEKWVSVEGRLERLEAGLAKHGTVVCRGNVFDRWDLEAGMGAMGSVRLRAMVEEHGSGKQLVRYRMWPRFPVSGFVAVLALLSLAALAGREGALVAGGVLTAPALLLLMWMLLTSAATSAAVLRAVSETQSEPASPAPASAAADAPPLSTVDGGGL